jgi:beta-lactamase class A
MRAAALIGLVAGLALPGLAAAAAVDPQQELTAELHRIELISGGRLGVSAVNLANNERVHYNAGERYPMASTFKLAVALTLLDQVDKRSLTLAQQVAIDEGNLSPGSGELKTTEPGAQKSASVDELLKVMIRDSDNTATDHLLALVGGPAAVMRRLEALGLGQIDVSRPAGQLVADSWGFVLPPPGERTRKNLAKALKATPESARLQAAGRFLQDRRDTASPDAMVALIERLRMGKALGPESTSLLLDHMQNCRTGPKRIKGELPRGVVVAHKTGTLTRVATNDVGIISLSLTNGPAVVAIYLRGSPFPIAQQERSIALAALALYRHYTR